ncbi:MAG: hypothetical protein ABI277_08095 [Burkholderiaceae bacterium]
MARFKKTTLHVVSAVAILLGIYATAGFVYALWTHADDAIVAWALIAVVAFVTAFTWQAYIAKKRRRAL